MSPVVDDDQRRAAEQHYGPLGLYGVHLSDVTADTADGVALPGVLALPEGVDCVPAVLIRSPYRAADFPPEVAAFFLGELIAWASHGYACLLQSTRTTTSYFDEAADGAAAVRWIDQQPWFDGRLGLTGGSYHAFSALATASTRPASLRAIATSMYSADRVSSWYPGGGFGLELALSWTARQQAGGADVTDDPYRHLPLQDADVAATGHRLDFYQERLAHPGDDPYWKPLDFTPVLDDLPAPLLHIDGWYDYHRTAFWEDFERLRTSSTSMPHRLVVGPWSHAGVDPLISFTERLQWFDTHIRGDGSRRYPELSYFRTGEQREWVHHDHWADPERLVLHAASDGHLHTSAQEMQQELHWVYDPADPTPSVQFLTIGRGDVGGFWDDRDTENRSDVCVVNTEPLSSPLTIAGNVRAAAVFSSDAVSADLFLRLLDVAPDGRVQHVAEGIRRVSGDRLGDGVPIEVDLGPAGHRFGAGHRIRLLIASGAHPYYNRNLGFDAPTGAATEIRVARQKVALGGSSGLRIDLPIAAQPEHDGQRAV